MKKYNQSEVLHELKHFLPAQAALKDFIHHNTLHAFQKAPFLEALNTASTVFGYHTLLPLEEYQDLYTKGKISKPIVDKILLQKKGTEAEFWKEKMLATTTQAVENTIRIGKVRNTWKKKYGIDLDTLIQPILFRLLCNFLDQGISIWPFPLTNKSFLTALREMERHSMVSIFKTKEIRKLFLNETCEINYLLQKLVGKEELYEYYLFDQQFSHSGWSGMVSSIEDLPTCLLDTRTISLQDLITLELLLELDALQHTLGNNWQDISKIIDFTPPELFAPVALTENHAIRCLWQEALEWNFYDQALAGIQLAPKQATVLPNKSFQAIFCIDDRECSFRRYLEMLDTNCETFGTPGFFGVEFYFQPQDGKFYTKVCPAPVMPKFLVKEKGTSIKRQKDIHFSKHAQSFHSGWLISQTIGFWSAFKLVVNIFRPSMGPAAAYSLKHMDKNAELSIENNANTALEGGLQIGFNIEEMANRVEAMLRSIGLIKDFAPLVYLLGHGASSVNNPHYSAYDCGACSGRAGSVNSRVFSFMANHVKVREILQTRGITIPETTQFIGGLHDTTRDELVFFDEKSLSSINFKAFNQHYFLFNKACSHNAKERSRRFESITTEDEPIAIHDKIFKRSVSLFEPRPELNHATNALCIIAKRSLTKHLFLDRRAFLNSYDYQSDMEGKYLLNIVNAATPVCGGINLEYYFSRVDNEKLGAGSKLPHNVMGLFGVANGTDGDLRPGLPSQMIEVHDPVRLLMIIEHYPEVVLATIQKNPATYEWFVNEWVHLVVTHPDTQKLYEFVKGEWKQYTTLYKVPVTNDVNTLITHTQENIPVHSLIPY